MAEWEVEVFEMLKHCLNVEADTRDEAYETAVAIVKTGRQNLYYTESEGITGTGNVYKA